MVSSDMSPVASATSGTLSARLRDSMQPLWRRHLEHPFVVALADGSLPQSTFEFYIRQDALFLDELTKTFAYATTKTNDRDEMEQFGKLLLNTLVVERSLHQQYAARFGLTPEQMAATPMAPTNYAYTRHLLTLGATGSLVDQLTAMLPCAWLYAEIGHHFAHATPPSPTHPYADWLATYSSPDFDAVGVWLRERLDHHAATLSPAQEARLFSIFRTSTRYEWLFWEMAWHREEWPA